jgi:internalin A
MTDLEIIKEIEKEIGINLESVEIKTWNSIGYELNQKGYVSGLGFHNCNLGNLETIFSFLKELKELTNLNLSGNNISDVSYLKELKGLTYLDLNDNNIEDVSYLKELKKLKNLNLSNNEKVKDFTSLIELKKIVNLDLSFNEQIKDFSFIKELNGLSNLNLSTNQIIDISFLKELNGLTNLDLSYNNLSDVLYLKELKGLTNLNLSSNNLSDVSYLKEFKGLINLDLSSNNLSDVSYLKELKGLTELNLSFNEICDVSFLKELKNLIFIDLFDNPLEIPPKEIAEQGINAIRNYFKQIKEQGEDYIYEAKLMIIGEPGVGKTTLANKIFDRNYFVPNMNKVTTRGINVRKDWIFRTKGNIDFKVNIWDFGGQYILNMLHQFFLTSDCLYVLMVDKRREHDSIDYWLNNINILGKNSPVIILFNEKDSISASSFIFYEKKYHELFPELDFICLDINLSDNKDYGFDILLKKIKEKLEGLMFTGKGVPTKWIYIRNELGKIRNKKYIYLKEYFNICHRFDIKSEKDCLLILNYLRKLGNILNFYEDPNLRNTIILDFNWVFNAIYAILLDKDVKNKSKNGTFSINDLSNIWNSIGLNFDEQNELLQLMLKDNFELCYKIPESKDEYIIPLLLPEIKPDYYWDNRNILRFRFQYPFMPNGIISRLIVRFHEFIENRLVWNKGVIFIRNGAKAQVIEQINNKEGIKIIDIQVSGNPNYRKELLLLIREEIRKIQKIAFPNLPYYEMVPCHCPECINVNEPLFFDYYVLEKLHFEKKYNSIQCLRSGDSLSISDLIDGIEIPDKKDNIGILDKITRKSDKIDDNDIFSINIPNVVNRSTNDTIDLINPNVIEPDIPDVFDIVFQDDNKADEKKRKSQNKTIKIFLASSNELESDRKDFREFIGLENDRLHNNGIYLKIIQWEYFVDAISESRLQDEYNKTIKNCDIFICLIFTKVGKFTNEEFDIAFGHFKKNKKPLIYTYFKNALVSITQIKKTEINTKFEFEEKLKSLEHYPTIYTNIDNLQNNFRRQLDKILSYL